MVEEEDESAVDEATMLDAETEDAAESDDPLSPAWSSEPVPDPVKPGTVAAADGVAVALAVPEDEEEEAGSPAFMFSPVPRRDLRMVGESPSTTVSLVPV